MSLADRTDLIEAVTFDVGMTLLYRQDRPQKRRVRDELRAWLQRRGLPPDSEAFSRSMSEVELMFVRLRAQARDREASQAIGDFVSSLELDLADGEHAELLRRLEHLFGDYPTRAPDGAADALRVLRERGVKLGIVSNRGRRPGWIAHQYLEVCGLLSFFEPRAIIWSDEVGARKPDPQIFRMALRALGTPPQRAAHVGDSVKRDVVAAKELGMTAIRYVGVKDDPGDAPQAHAVISHYRDLPATLGLEPRPRR